MKDWMRRLKGVNSAAMTRVETTMVSWLLFLAGERCKDYLGRRNAPEIHQRKHQRERAIDESAVYEEVYVVEPIAQDRYPYCDRNRRYKGYIECKPHSLEPEGCVYHSGDDVCKDSGARVCRSSVSKPFDLLTLNSYGTAQSYKHC